MDYDIRLERVPGRSLAVVGRRASLAELSRVVPEACGAVWQMLRARRIEGAGRNVAVYLDDRINLEVGVEMDRPFEAGGELLASSTPPGTVATTVHFGPYQQLGEAHQAVQHWCAAGPRDRPPLLGNLWSLAR